MPTIKEENLRRELLFLLWDNPKRAEGIPFVELPANMQLGHFVPDCANDGLVCFAHRNHITEGGGKNAKIKLEPGYSIARHGEPGFKQAWEIAQEARTEKVRKALRLRVQLAPQGGEQASRLASDRECYELTDRTETCPTCGKPAPVDKAGSLRCPKCRDLRGTYGKLWVDLKTGGPLSAPNASDAAVRVIRDYVREQFGVFNSEGLENLRDRLVRKQFIDDLKVHETKCSEIAALIRKIDQDAMRTQDSAKKPAKGSPRKGKKRGRGRLVGKAGDPTEAIKIRKRQDELVAEWRALYEAEGTTKKDFVTLQNKNGSWELPGQPQATQLRVKQFESMVENVDRRRRYSRSKNKASQ